MWERSPSDGPTGHAPMSAPAVRVERRGRTTWIHAAAYTLSLDPDGIATVPYAVVRDLEGRVWSALNLLSSVHTLESADETWRVEDCVVQPGPDEVCVVVRTRSAAWTVHELTLICRGEQLELSVRVQGRGRLADVLLLGGEATLANGAAGMFASSIDVASLLVPAPGEPVQLVRSSHSGGQLGVVGDAAPGRLHAVFSPPPLAFGLGREAPTGATSVPGGDWLGLSLRAPVAELTFTSLAYRPLDGGFLLRLAYEGHTVVDGTWRSPLLVLRPAASGWDVLADHRRDLVEHGCAPAGAPEPQPWWSEPLFCGWGAQCARVSPALALQADGSAALPHLGVNPIAEHLDRPATPAAADLAREDVYDAFLAQLAAHDLHPGTVVVDDRWQAVYGTAVPDPTHWPDLRRWVDGQHEQGRRVLLWFKAWDPAGLPPEECVLDAGGRPVAADPANPRYLQRLAAVVDHLLSPAGLDVDGLKVDFTQRAPSGTTLRAIAGGVGHRGPAHPARHAVPRGETGQARRAGGQPRRPPRLRRRVRHGAARRRGPGRPLGDARARGRPAPDAARHRPPGPPAPPRRHRPVADARPRRVAALRRGAGRAGRPRAVLRRADGPDG